MNKICRKWTSLFLLLLFTCCGNSMAAAPTGSNGAQTVLGLDELVRMALERSPELKQAEMDVQSARSDLQQAKAGQWAQMDVTAIAGPVPNADEPYVKVNSKGIGYLQNDEGGIGIFGKLEINIVQPLYTFGKISNRQDAAASGVAVQKAGKEKKRGDVMLNVKELYFGLIAANQGKGAAEDADTFLRDAQDRIKRLISLGSTNVDQSDLYRLEAYRAEIEQFKYKADSGARMAYLALKTAVGMPPGKDFVLDARELPREPILLASQEEYVRNALARRPELDQLRKGIDAQKSMVEASQADLYPSLFLAAIGSFAGAPGREHLAGFYIRDEFNHADAGLVLGAQWHFDLGIGKGKVNKALAEYQKLMHTKEYAEQNIPLEVAKYYQDAEDARISFESYKKSATASRKWVVAAFSNFDMGVGTARDMFDAIDRYGKNQGEYLLSLYNYHLALARLSHAAAEYLTGSKG
ncbi:MAG: TolC family protein [Syntrophobacteraceae bacterium]|nr:TolC family protein [Desulfobacteraceae bacterium]